MAPNSSKYYMDRVHEASHLGHDLSATFNLEALVSPVLEGYNAGIVNSF